MSPDKIEILLTKYPHLFNEKNFYCGDGWFNLILEMCKIIDHHFQIMPSEMQNLFKIIQLKEKFGSLVIYSKPRIPYIDGIIDLAESISRFTCEICGDKGVISIAPNKHLMQCLCENHTKERNEKHL